MTEFIVALFIVLFGGGGIVWAITKTQVKEIAKETMQQDINDLKNEDDKLHIRINKVEDNFVTCNYCNMQHANLKGTLETINSKIDILLEKGVKNA